MKKQHIVLLSLLVAAVFVGAMIYLCPAKFLRSVAPEDVAVIEVRSGHSGASFSVDSPEEIAYLVNQIRGASFHRDGISLFYMGTSYTLTFCDSEGDALEKLIVNSDSFLRKDPFFYQTLSDLQIVPRLRALELNASLEEHIIK